MNYFRPLYPFLLGIALIFSSKTFFNLALLNSLGQFVIFTLVVCIPIWRTGRMSYVDIGWPWGLVWLGVINLFYSEGYWLRSFIVSGAIILVGLRMGLAALNMWRLGFLKKELPRYQYQRIIWKKRGKTNTSLALQVDAISQGLANASILALPIFIIGSNNNQEFAILEIVGFMIWFLAFVMESIADYQKIYFLRKMKRAGNHLQVCNVGLWKYSRHPNYFSEWMVWNGLIIAAIPSWLALQGSELWLLLGLSLLYASIAMYTALVYITGAVPSEYYSLKKRPDYKTYQKQTNRFFPGPRKSGTVN
ncbi:MAG: hypothetical protein CMD96_01755 [Gammaproteobacteria bacterium]|mgnify:FL=1|jgi:steroid 5-alpha reductase family enzyme|nr:hypothetical protein [Gammaproteobacteria bacterium]|tara:strand:+ start:4163 stop:5080 length:918 start_codon:yes stop_codon:yes gene_type:complete